MMEIEGFMHVSLLDPNIWYYNIKLLPGSKYICTILLLWVNYKYQKLPMRVCKSNNILQENIYEIFEVFNMFCGYIDNILFITTHKLLDRLKALQNS